jgi:ribosomal protein L37AE/L43A
MIMAKGKILKVTAKVREIYVEPDYEAQALCPYCTTLNKKDIDDDNFTEIWKCAECKLDFKVKIPKYL